MTKKLYILLFALAFFSCTQKKRAGANADLLYFDLQGYFAKESLRMQKLNPTVAKTVSVNGALESKKTKIVNWEKEFAIFANADINKTSWRGSFKFLKHSEFDEYTSNNKKIPVKKLLVASNGSNVKMIQIIINYKNVLYQSNDTLTYYPDSIYDIKKKQKIRILKEKNYQIIGRIK